MKKKNLITVIIPCYNEVNTIGIIVDKINKLRKLNIQIIVIDDCSTDGSSFFIKKNLINKIDKY